MFFVSDRHTLDLCRPCFCWKVIAVSRLSEMLRAANTENLGVRDISRRAQDMGLTLSAGTVSRYMNGQHPETPNATTVAAFARVLNVSAVELQMAATFSGREPFVPDPASDRLTPPQRAVLNDLIRVMVDSNEKAGDGSADDSTSLTHAEVSSATEEQQAARNLYAKKKRLRAVDGLKETPYYTEPPAREDTAAYEAPNRGRKMKEEQDHDAERSQDLETDDQ